MFLHLADDSIFLDYAIDQFEAIAPDYNIYLVNSNSPQKIKNIEKIITAESNSNQYQYYIKKLSQFDGVILHALTDDKIKIVNNADTSVKFAWMFWGADAYYINKIRTNLFSKKTKKILKTINDNSSFIYEVKQFLYSMDVFSVPYSLINKGNFPADYQRRKAMKRVDFCAPVIEDDYYMIKKKLNLKCKLLPFSYGTIESLVHDFENDNFSQNTKNTYSRILLGNSADPSNNHIDILYLLQKLNFTGEIVCPLSYGDVNYRDFLIKIGYDIFGNKFKPLTDFIPLQQYQSLLRSCGIVIMNHYRQQGMGNIISSLYNGSKIFLNEKNPVYTFLKRNNAVIFSITNILKLSESFSELTFDEIKQNQTFIINHYSREKVLTKTKIFVDTIKKMR
ncbi:MAG: TDP-N-acetylfucosamine:lipid II N-acetylfucosaminyltransferase [Bacteroidetes bacterium]|nr:TDP-N-acetylfucosamine:lipid II N-acetylfucosaminyltransferase [Bacteroidota bacterium]